MKKLKRLIIRILKLILPYSTEYSNINTRTPLQVGYMDLLKFHMGLLDRHWPAHKNCIIVQSEKIYLGINSKIGRPGNYIQGCGGIYIGNYVQVASNVGILSQNHDLYNHNVSVKKEVIIGDYSWIGMNSMILPGVILGKRTIVAAGSVVTKSFPEGYCVIGGNPAKVIKKLEVSKCNFEVSDLEYYGFYKKSEYELKFPKRVNILNEKLKCIVNEVGN